MKYVGKKNAKKCLEKKTLLLKTTKAAIKYVLSVAEMTDVCEDITHANIHIGGICSTFVGY